MMEDITHDDCSLEGTFTAYDMGIGFYDKSYLIII